MSDFTSILNRMLESVSDDQDKRQSSIVFNALSPTAAELAQLYIAIEIYKDQTNLLTATGDNLDNIGLTFSLEREPATFAIRIAETFDTNGIPIDLTIGSRFGIPNIAGGINFVLTENLETSGQCLLTCETAGTIGNSYLGPLLPLFSINNLGTATMIGTQIPADDIETDDNFRKRILERLNQKTFGGNIADYKRFTKAIDGVGDLKVFPVWDGGGTVKLSVIDSSYDSITDNFIEYIKNIVDPDEYTGEGIGIAPIGHKVTVVTPKRNNINVRATVMLSGYTTGQIQAQAEQNIRDYFLLLRKEWSDSDDLNIFNLLIANAILNVPGVVNVPKVLINEIDDDLILSQTADLQQLPYLGVLTLNE